MPCACVAARLRILFGQRNFLSGISDKELCTGVREWSHGYRKFRDLYAFIALLSVHLRFAVTVSY